MNPTQTYTRADLIAWLGQREVLKGEAYLDRVPTPLVGPEWIEATVQGTARFPYHVEIAFHLESTGEYFIDAHCTCPVGRNCKHVAASLLKVLADREAPLQVNPEVLNWLELFRKVAVPTTGKKTAKTASSPDCLYYLLGRRSPVEQYRIYMLKGRAESDKLPASCKVWTNMEQALVQPPRFVDEDDLVILRLLRLAKKGQVLYHDAIPLPMENSAETLAKLQASGRFFYLAPNAAWRDFVRLAQPVREGEARTATLAWRENELGGMTPHLVAEPAAEIMLILDELWYVDRSGLLGRLSTPYPAAQVGHLLALPPLKAVDVPVVVGALHELAPDLPLPAELAELRVIEEEPLPILELLTLAVSGLSQFRGYDYSTKAYDCAQPRFRYGELTVAADDKGEFFTLADGETVRIKRQEAGERQWIKSLEDYGLLKTPGHVLNSRRGAPHPLYGLEDEDAWMEFMEDGVPALRAAGWEVEVPGDFRHQHVDVAAWEADIEENENGWFSLDMGIVVEGRRMPLAPLLHDLFRSDPRWLDAALLNRLDDRAAVILTLPDGTRVRVYAERLKPIARTLIDLFDGRLAGPLRLSRLDAPRLAEIAASPSWSVRGGEAVRGMAERLRHAAGIRPAAPPAGLGMQLRPYQLEGLAWLQFLREQQLAGILADDMGLGKTAQTLAHLLLEKEAGRLDRPALVVLPTSLIFNWKREAERFAPALRVLSLHGKDRAERFPLIAEHDVVLTTYPLLWRDEEALAAQPYHLLILDEAQTVKNAASQAAQVVRKLTTRHRLCLTGTPLENHLGELWAQFDFLLPSFLGDAKGFTRMWRTPIEKNGDRLRRDLLASRVKPFILRRRKEDVAKELPPKTIIVRTVELQGAQRDLYETVRSAMDKRVRDEIVNKGFARSQIVILDALLKLRQVCCDPRLLKSAGVQKVKERAKLDLLMEMLPELVEEGRRVLVFSQFTSMLALIEPELVRAKLDYVLLTGDTQDRESVVRRFQDGEVPIFLISLKAGGVGLNLTAADTVIHYDPWWNPAVENQATDRAHRLGQAKNVFVYKLVVAGSIEEKILALQDKKAALAAGILSEDADGLAKFGETDIAALLAPLPVESEKGRGR
ncbi:MAG: helicase [Sulfuricella sp.]|nr:helicase [Sulfuricella sp.]